MMLRPFALILSLIFVSFLALNAPASVYATQDEEPEEEEDEDDEDTWVDEDDEFVDVSREYYERDEVERGEREGDPDNPSPKPESGFGVGLSSVFFPPEGHPDNRPQPVPEGENPTPPGHTPDPEPSSPSSGDQPAVPGGAAGQGQGGGDAGGTEVPAPKPGGDTAASTWPDGSVHTSVENVDGSHTVTHTSASGVTTTEVVP